MATEAVAGLSRFEAVAHAITTFVTAKVRAGGWQSRLRPWLHSCVLPPPHHATTNALSSFLHPNRSAWTPTTSLV
jgi:hypothetical protein